MPKLLDRQEGDISDPVVTAHADPEERPGQLDGMLVDGLDPFAARRQMMREAHDGHPDPEPQDAPRRGPGRPPKSTTTQPAPEWTPLAIEDFEAMVTHLTVVNPLAVRACDLLPRHRCISIRLEGKAAESMRGSLKTVARHRGWNVHIKVSRGTVAVRLLSTTTANDHLTHNHTT